MTNDKVLTDKTLPFYVFSLFAFWFSPIFITKSLSFGDIIFSIGLSTLLIYRNYNNSEIFKIVTIMSIINIFTILYVYLTLIMDKYRETTNVNDMYHVLVNIQHIYLIKNIIIFFSSALISLYISRVLSNKAQKVVAAIIITLLFAQLIRSI